MSNNKPKLEFSTSLPVRPICLSLWLLTCLQFVCCVSDLFLSPVGCACVLYRWVCSVYLYVCLSVCHVYLSYLSLAKGFALFAELRGKQVEKEKILHRNL